jgi:hypothetical protein
MKRFVLIQFTIIAVLLITNAAQAQWVRRYYHPVFVPAPQPVMRVSRAPVVVYQPTTVVTTRHRPILGGTVTHARPGYRRVVVW